MKYRLIILSTLLFSLSSATSSHTMRIAQFANERVTAWQTIIYPSKKQTLKMHHHKHDRVVVALDDGLLKITNSIGRVHYLKLKKGHSYYLSRDAAGEFHNDQNISPYPIRMVVIELAH